MRSNATLGNLIQDGTSIGADTSYNAFLDPDGLRDYLLFSKCPHLVLNGTYNNTIFDQMKLEFYRTEGKKYIVNPNVAVHLKFIFHKTMQFLQNFLDSDLRTDMGLKLWDVITTFLLLEYPMKQKSVRSQLLVSWTGKTQIEENVGNNANCFVELDGKDFDREFVMRFFT